jgi:signal transduction histidine kinase
MDIAYNSNDKLAILYGDYVWFFFFFIFLMTILNFRVLLREFKQVKTDNKKRKRIGLLLIGLTFFFVMNAIFNIGLPVFGRVVHLYEYGDYSTIVFLIIIAYATMRLGFFGARIVVTSFVISFLGSFLLLDAIIFTQNIYQAVGKGIIFLIFIPFAILLLRSVLSEIEQRKKLQEANVKLGELTRQQQDIIDVMGHEIRTPLTAIVQELNLQKNIFLPKIKEFKKALDEKKAKTLGYVAEGLDTIDKASKQAVDLVNDMLETARLDKDRFKLDYSEFDITQLIADSVQVMSKTTEADVDIQVKLPDDDEITIEADRKRIKEGLYALLNNAIKYRDKSKEENWIKVCLSINEDMVEISVIDNGIGIREEDIPKLGKKFFRLDGEMKGGVKKPGGTGLGLYVVCGIMKHHKGELIIESEGLGNGSIFTMRFPKS